MDENDNGEGKFDLRNWIGALKRRRKPILLAAICGVAAVGLFAMFLPASYRSTGTILIEQQEVPQDLVRSTVTSYADQRVQVISQRVMTTTKLLDIIRRYGLYPGKREHETREELMERMRDDIQLKMISADVIDPRSGLPRTATIAFTVSYVSPAPDKAAKVANELTTLYLDENLTERNRLAKNATDFLVEEGNRLSGLIAELEGKLAQFKSKHADALPELQGMNMQLLDRTEQQLLQSETRLMSLDQQRVYLQAQLAQLKPHSMLVSDSGERIMSSHDRLTALRSQLASAKALYSADHPDVERMEREIRGLQAETDTPATAGNEIQRELDTARSELATARERYSPQHPDVQRLEQRVTSLESALKEQLAEPVAAPAKRSESPDNPAYIQIQAQLSATESDRQALETQMREQRAQVAANRRSLMASPGIEKEYRELARDYESAQLKYREVRSKEMEAQAAQNLEADRKGERFTLIEPPLPPERPVSPNRPAILLIGFVLTLAACTGLLALLETADATVRGRQDMIETFTIPPMALVPRITTASEVRAGKRRIRLTIAATAASALASLAVMHLFVRPLDVLWYLALRRFGL